MNKGLTIVLVGLILNILETWYFGWNLTPQTVLEAYADIVTGIIIVMGFLVFAKRNIK